MPDLVDELVELGRALPPEDRARLVERLLQSLHEPTSTDLHPEWEAEIQRRLNEYDRGEAEAIDAEVVFAEVRQMLKRAR